ncbi:sulfurtransferase [Enterococcus sp. AZ109]|uniref:sulfurtransferase n=1 Tax=Enterococcus sp. AZ109 TaxID=2774634 RepID=UPI003F1F1EB2
MNKHFFVDAATAYHLLLSGYKALAVGNQQTSTYEQLHLAGAIYMDTNEIEAEATGWNILSADKCRRVFAAKGVTINTPLLIYSDNLSAACRVAFVAYWLGISRMKILEDGLLSWQANGFPLDEGASGFEKAQDGQWKGPERTEVLLSTSEDLLAAKVRNPELVLASVRSWAEYSGMTSSYSYIEQAGEPGGAVFAPASCGKDEVADLLTIDQRLKPLPEIAQTWQKAGIIPEKEIVFYCGTGWRASTAFFVAKELGWTKVRLFDGGGYDWSKKHSKNPQKFPIKK